jgi:hypothetical protein
MDRFIAQYEAEPDADLMLCRARGVAWQADRAHRVAYDAAYFDKCAGYEGTEIEKIINASRVELVDMFVGVKCEVLDVGIGSGAFIRQRANTFGLDVNPRANAWLQAVNRFADDIETFPAFTFWDVIEHLDDPAEYFDRIRHGSYLFASLPIFDDLTRIRDSKHYRPGEHLTYFTHVGFIGWMAEHRFEMLRWSEAETRAGRDSILSFAFRKLR